MQVAEIGEFSRNLELNNYTYDLICRVSSAHDKYKRSFVHNGSTKDFKT